MALDGKTPAEASGIKLNLEGNKWMNLIKQSVNPTPQIALGERAKDVVYAKTQDSDTFKPKRWFDREERKEINDILRTFGYAWLSQGKDSLWLKPTEMHHPPSAPSRRCTPLSPRIDYSLAQSIWMAEETHVKANA